MDWTTLKVIKTPRVTLRVQWVYDYDYENDVQDEHGNPCQETQDNLDDGTWAAYGFRVVIYVDGHELGQSAIWGSIYESPEDGYRNRVSGYLPDMVSEACSEARKAINKLSTLRKA